MTAKTLTEMKTRNPMALGLCLWLIMIFNSGLAAAQPTWDLQAKVKEFAAGTETTLTFPPGRYALPKEGLVLRKLKGRSIIARGVTLVGTDLNATALQFQECVDVAVDGLTLDYDPLPFTQGRLTAVDRTNRTADFQVSAGYPELEAVYLEGKNVHLFEKDSPRWKEGVPDYYPRKIERLAADKGRLVFSENAAGLDQLAVGDRVVLNVRKKPGILVGSGCAGVRFINTTIHSAPGIGILIRFAEDAGTYEKVRVVPGPRPEGAGEDRLFSTSADAFNAAYARKGPVIKGCDFSFMGDDAVNLHGVMLPVVKWLNDRSFVSMRAHKSERFDLLIRPGDEVRFLKPPTYVIAATGRVEEASLWEKPDAGVLADIKKIWPTSKGEGEGVFYVIKLKERVAGVEPGDFCDIPATSAPGFEIRDSVFHDHRARGLRLMSNDGVVENCRFERLKGVAISIGPEYAFWREAGWCSDLVIRGNHITDVGLGANLGQADNYTTGAITIMGRRDPSKTDKSHFQGNARILVTGNVIEGCPVNGISVSAAKEVEITGNTIRKVNLVDSPKMAADYGLGEQKPISVPHGGAVLRDNVVDP
jgi:hypothetical protein